MRDSSLQPVVNQQPAGWHRDPGDSSRGPTVGHQSGCGLADDDHPRVGEAGAVEVPAPVDDDTDPG